MLSRDELQWEELRDSELWKELRNSGAKKGSAQGPSHVQASAT